MPGVDHSRGDEGQRTHFQDQDKLTSEMKLQIVIGSEKRHRWISILDSNDRLLGLWMNHHPINAANHVGEAIKAIAPMFQIEFKDSSARRWWKKIKTVQTMNFK